MSVLYLIRHGMTMANIEHRYCGSTDISLSVQGKEMLQNLHYESISANYYTSGMLRTNETMEILFKNTPYIHLPELREIDFGLFEMKTYEELKGDIAYQNWLTGDNERNVPPNGESGEQMKERILRVLPRLLKQDTVVVTHGGVIAVIMEELFPNEDKNRYSWQPAPGHGYKITKDCYCKIP